MITFFQAALLRKYDFVVSHLKPKNYYSLRVFKMWSNFLSLCHLHCVFKVSRSQAKFNEGLANYFSKTKAVNKCFIYI